MVNINMNFPQGYLTVFVPLARKEFETAYTVLYCCNIIGCHYTAQ